MYRNNVKRCKKCLCFYLYELPGSGRQAGLNRFGTIILIKRQCHEIFCNFFHESKPFPFFCPRANRSLQKSNSEPFTPESCPSLKKECSRDALFGKEWITIISLTCSHKRMIRYKKQRAKQLIEQYWALNKQYVQPLT